MQSRHAANWFVAPVLVALLVGLISCGPPAETPAVQPTATAGLTPGTPPPTEAAAAAPSPTVQPSPTTQPTATIRPTQAPTATTRPTATVQPSPPPAGAAGMAQVGQRVEAEGYALTVTDVSTVGEIQDFLTPDEGNTFLVTEAVIEDVSVDEGSYNVLNFSVRDSSGATYNTELLAPDPALSAGDMVPGDRVRGNIAFEVPQSASGFVLHWEPTFIARAVRVDLGR